jgi:ABC-type uncharacterized transport system involved in gliding motility auxiliary subunit
MAMKRGLIATIGLILAVIVFVAVNVIANQRLATLRADLTSDRLYTLSDGTRTLLSKLDEPINLRLYVSERLVQEIPSYGVFATRIREMLQEYQNDARGRLRLQVIDPKPFTDDEDRAVASGLQGVPVSQGGDMVYFGLAGTNTADKEEVIAFFQPDREAFLEYDLTKLVYNLATPKKKSVGVMTSLPMAGEFRGMGAPPAPPWQVYTQLGQFFDVRVIESTATEIPADIGVLVIVHPKNLTDKTLYAIDQYVLNGGRAMVFVDPHAEGEMSRPGLAQQTGQTASSLTKLFDAWGIEMVDGKFAGDRRAARRVNAGIGQRVTVVDYVSWLRLDQSYVDANDILTANVGSLQLASAGILKQKPGATTEFLPLVKTSSEAEAIDVAKIKMAPDPSTLLAEFKSGGEALTLAARVRGTVKTAFPDGRPVDPPPAAAEEKPAEDKPGEAQAAPPAPPPAPAPDANFIAQSRDPVNLIVVADTDMLEDRFWVTVQDFFGQQIVNPQANNGDFVINSVDNLLGSNELIGLRSRGLVARPFVRVQDLQRDAELQFRAKERELTEKLRDTEKKLTDLQTTSPDQGAAAAAAGAGGRSILTREQQETIEQFRGELLSIRKELRDVQQNLRRDIDKLELTLKFLNIGLIPLLVAIVAVIVGLARLRRRRPARTIATQGAE